MKKNKIDKKNAIILFEVIGAHLRRHALLLIAILCVILLFDLVFIYGWFYSPDVVSKETEINFYIVHGLLFVVTLAVVILLIFVKFGKLKNFTLALLNHLYALFLVAWGVVVFRLDLSLGFSPMVFLLITTFVAGIFVIDPIFFALAELLSLIPISIVIAKDPNSFFGGTYFSENIIIFITFIILIIIICFRNYRVIYSNFKYQKLLEDLSFKDGLTGLLNERSYVNDVEGINKRIKQDEDVKFAVVMMDVNNLKPTNDKYGHRFGCSLIVKCGELLPTIFPTSKSYHVGGDEFITIVEGEDLINLEDRIKDFDRIMQFATFEYEGVNLVFSVARGYHVRKENEYYKDVLQVADSEMYKNKEALKKKHNLSGR